MQVYVPIRLIQKLSILTDSSKDDVTAALVTPPALMLARTGAPNPIDASCRLINITKSLKFPVYNALKHDRLY